MKNDQFQKWMSGVDELTVAQRSKALSALLWPSGAAVDLGVDGGAVFALIPLPRWRFGARHEAVNATTGERGCEAPAHPDGQQSPCPGYQIPQAASDGSTSSSRPTRLAGVAVEAPTPTNTSPPPNREPAADATPSSQDMADTPDPALASPPAAPRREQRLAAVQQEEQRGRSAREIRALTAEGEERKREQWISAFLEFLRIVAAVCLALNGQPWVAAILAGVTYRIVGFVDRFLPARRG